MATRKHLRMSYMGEETAKALNYILCWPTKIGPMPSDLSVAEVVVRMKEDGFPFSFVLDGDLPRDSQCLLAFSSTIKEETDLGEWTALIHTEETTPNYTSKMLIFARDDKTFMRLVFLNGITIDRATTGGKVTECP